MWTPEQEKAADKLLERLRKEPLAKEREEFGLMLMKHVQKSVKIILLPFLNKKFEFILNKSLIFMGLNNNPLLIILFA
jgi:hypothetical protein